MDGVFLFLPDTKNFPLQTTAETLTTTSLFHLAADCHQGQKIKQLAFADFSFGSNG